MDKAALYDDLNSQLRRLLRGQRDLIANAANTAAMIFHTLPGLNWAGFYFLQGDELVLGPFQGKPACVRIPLGRGVCGTGARRRQTVLVEDVHQFPGHIACDTGSNSEIVLPIIAAGRLIGVLDLDSPSVGRFNAEDQAGLEKLVEVFVAATETGPAS